MIDEQIRNTIRAGEKVHTAKILQLLEEMTSLRRQLAWYKRNYERLRAKKVEEVPA